MNIFAPFRQFKTIVKYHIVNFDLTGLGLQNLQYNNFKYDPKN